MLSRSGDGNPWPKGSSNAGRRIIIRTKVLLTIACCRLPLAAVRAGVRRDRDEPAAQYGSSPDSPLEESGFDLTVPSDRSVSNQGRQPLCNARRFGAGMGTETSKGSEAVRVGLRRVWWRKPLRS